MRAARIFSQLLSVSSAVNPWFSSALDLVDDQLTWDMQYGYRLEFTNDNAMNTMVGLLNVTDEDPPKVYTNMGFDTKVHDPRGRMFYAKVRYEF